MNDRSASSHASPAASPFGDVKRLTMPTSPPRTKSGSGLPTSPTRGDERASPAKAVSPFYSTRMKDTSETSAATDLFRKGAEQIVLDHDKQAKLANLIKAVTVQKQALTEEREQAIAGFKAERAKLRTMQRRTLSLYAKMKTEAIAPVSVDVRDIDSSDDEGPGGVASYDMAREAGSIFASLRRGSDERLVFERWRSWAKQRAVAEAHVRRMTRRWELTRLARSWRAWWRLAVNDGRGTAAAAELAATRSKKRVGRRAFAAWRGVAAGLDEEELAKLSSASAKFVAGSPAAGLVAIAQLARSRGGTDADTRRRIVADAVAAADRSAGAFDVEDILGGAEGSERFLSPTSPELEDDARGEANAVAVRAAAILFCKTARGTTRNVVMAWAAAAARARAARLSDEVNALRFEQAEAEAAAMVAAEAAAMVAAEAAAETKATAESEKKAAKSKSFLSAFRGPSRKSTDKKSFAASPNDDSGLSASPSAKSTARAASPAGLSATTPATASPSLSPRASLESSATSSAPTGKVPSVDEAEPAKAKPAKPAKSARTPDRQISVASSSDNALPPAPESPKNASTSSSDRGEEDALPPVPAQKRVAAKAKAPAADAADVELETKDAVKTWSEDPPVEVPAAEAPEESEKKQPACCVIM